MEWWVNCSIDFLSIHPSIPFSENPFVRSVHPFIDAFIIIKPFIHPFIHPFFHSSIDRFIRPLIYTFAHWFSDSLIDSVSLNVQDMPILSEHSSCCISVLCPDISSCISPHQRRNCWMSGDKTPQRPWQLGSWDIGTWDASCHKSPWSILVMHQFQPFSFRKLRRNLKIYSHISHRSCLLCLLCGVQVVPAS